MIKTLDFSHQPYVVPIQRKRTHTTFQMSPHGSVQKRSDVSCELAFLGIVSASPNTLRQYQLSHALQFGERFFLRNRSGLRILLGFVEKPVILVQLNLQYPIPHQLTAQLHKLVVQFPPSASIQCVLVLLG